MRYLVIVLGLRTLSPRSQLAQLHSVQLHHCRTLTDTAEQSCLYTLFRAKLYGWDATDCHDHAHWNKKNSMEEAFFYYQSINQSIM